MKFFLAPLCALLACGPAFAGSYTFSALPSGFVAEGINNVGQISGFTFQLGAPSCGNLAGCPAVPAIYSNGSVASLSLPIPSSQFAVDTFVYINDKADLAGYTVPGPAVPFVVFDGKLVTGTLPDLGSPNDGPIINGLNDARDIIGYAFRSNGDPVGFISNGGKYTLLDTSAQDLPTGISNAGEVVGTTTSGAGFLYAGGAYSAIRVPGATVTKPVAIDVAGEIAGTYSNGRGVSNGFVDNGGVFTTLFASDGQPFIPVGLNDHGQVIGYAADSPYASFLATPQAVPEPISATLFGAGLAGLAALRRRAA